MTGPRKVRGRTGDRRKMPKKRAGKGGVWKKRKSAGMPL